MYFKCFKNNVTDCSTMYTILKKMLSCSVGCIKKLISSSEVQTIRCVWLFVFQSLYIASICIIKMYVTILNIALSNWLFNEKYRLMRAYIPSLVTRPRVILIDFLCKACRLKTMGCDDARPRRFVHCTCTSSCINYVLWTMTREELNKSVIMEAD